MPVKNYSTEYEPGVVAGILILRGVYEALNSATDYLREAAEGGDFEATGEFRKLKVTPAARLCACALQHNCSARAWQRVIPLPRCMSWEVDITHCPEAVHSKFSDLLSALREQSVG